jgi:hypothetical protein
MVLYKAIKYKILEYCLDLILNGLNGFGGKRFEIGVNDLYVGMQINRIELGGRHSLWWTNCVITEVPDKTASAHKFGSMLGFNFGDSNIPRSDDDRYQLVSTSLLGVVKFYTKFE